MSYATDWHTQSQTMRNHDILYKAMEYVGTYGGECKPWVQNVVTLASNGAGIVPLTTNNGDGYTWENTPGPDAGKVSEDLNSPNVHVGMIVQMRIRYKDGSYVPHTAIIYGKNSTGVTWIESNKQGDGMVRVSSFQTYAQFYATLETLSSYSIYYIK